MDGTAGNLRRNERAIVRLPGEGEKLFPQTREPVVCFYDGSRALALWGQIYCGIRQMSFRVGWGLLRRGFLEARQTNEEARHCDRNEFWSRPCVAMGNKFEIYDREKALFRQYGWGGINQIGGTTKCTLEKGAIHKPRGDLREEGGVVWRSSMLQKGFILYEQLSTRRFWDFLKSVG